MVLITDEQYYRNLPPAGLALAKEQAAEYFENALQDDDFPTRDVVAGLLLIHEIEQEQQKGGAACA